MSRRKVVVTTFKNEAPYILEWVAHYQVLGFDDIVVYTNDCTDGTNQILSRLQELGQVIFCINRVGPGGVHRSALRQARRLDVVKNAAWVFVCDIDEFLNIHVGNHKVDDLIEATGGDVDAISIPWRIFSNNGRSVLRNQLVTKQFTDAELPPVSGGATRRFVKTLFKPSDKFRRIGLHGPVLSPEYLDDLIWSVPGGARKARNSMGGHIHAPFGYDVAQLNHYAVRSVSSYLIKRHRGRANHMTDTLGLEYWERWNRGGEEDLSIHRYLPELEKKLKEYQSDAILARLHRKAFAWHKDLVGNLIKQPEYIDLKKKCENLKVLVPPPSERPTLPVRAPTTIKQQQEIASRSKLPHIGSLWIGSSLSYVEQMCLLSFVRQGHPVTLFTYGSVKNIPQDVMVADAREIHDPEAFLYSKFGTPVVQSDIFRLKLIQQTGMIWADADMFCLKPIKPDNGHVHGYFSGESVCNAILRLPQRSKVLKEYQEYVSDSHPIPPWWPEDKRAEAEALKENGKWKHASEQQHDVFGPPALTWFLNKHGMTKYSEKSEVYYPVAFKSLDILIKNSDVEDTHFTENTCAVHLWGRRLRWRLPGLGMEEGGFVHNSLKKLEINPQLAPLEKEQEPDIWAPARLLPRTSTNEQVIETCEIELSNRQKRGLQEDGADCAIRLAEHFLRQAKDTNLFGINNATPKGTLRGIDHHGTGAQGAFRIANSILRYAHHHKKVPDFMRPRGFTEHLNVWKHLAPMAIPTPADKLNVLSLVPQELRKNILIPDRPWVSKKPSLPQNGELADGVYLLKANHNHGTTLVQYPLTEAERMRHDISAKTYLANPHGFWGGEWWYMHIQPELFLETQLEGATLDTDAPIWKFWTIGGHVEIVQVDLNRSGQQTQLVHDRDLTLLDETLYLDSGQQSAERPENYTSMVEVAEAIGRNIDFARIDFYNTPNGIVLGDVAVCPASGCHKIQSRSLDLRLGRAFAKAKFFKAH